MSVNVDLLRRTLAHIEQHPEEWDQGTWHCGTSACFAGHAALLAGAAWDGAHSSIDVVGPRGAHQSVWKYAKRALGITAKQAFGPDGAGGLFASTNTLDDLRRIVGELCDGAE